MKILFVYLFTLIQLLCVSAIPAKYINHENRNDNNKNMKFIASPEEHGSFAGRGTFYEVGSGSCGAYDTDDELVVAVNRAQMDNGANPNSNPKCEHMVSISGTDGTVVARIVDTCPSCDEGSLDMSPTVFQKVCGGLGKGTCGITWSFL